MLHQRIDDVDELLWVNAIHLMHERFDIAERCQEEVVLQLCQSHVSEPQTLIDFCHVP